MKQLIFLLLIVSCTKIKNEEIKGTTKSSPQVSALRQDLKNYSSYVDVMVAFLWPERFETDDQRTALKKVIRTSRDLRSRKEDFLDKRFELRQSYVTFECKCLLEGLCDGSETQDDEAKCYEIEEAIYENDRRLPAIYELVDEIKLNVLAAGGDWIDTHQDFSDVSSPMFDFENMSLTLTAFSATSREPVSYLVTSPKVFQEAGYQRILFSTKRKDGPGIWEFEVTPTLNRASLLFQGDLRLIHGSQERVGIIYWEHERKP
jgi:hypothetical protein